jgi:hypothetical protein
MIMKIGDLVEVCINSREEVGVIIAFDSEKDPVVQVDDGCIVDYRKNVRVLNEERRYI